MIHTTRHFCIILAKTHFFDAVMMREASACVRPINRHNALWNHLDRQVTAKPLTNMPKQTDPGWSLTRVDWGLQRSMFSVADTLPVELDGQAFRQSCDRAKFTAMWKWAASPVRKYVRYRDFSPLILQTCNLHPMKPSHIYKGINHQNFSIYLLYIVIANGETSFFVKALLFIYT